MLVYRYDPETKIFLYSEPAMLDPLETQKAGKNIYLMPANCTDVEPPVSKDGFDIVFVDGKLSFQEQEKKEEPSHPEPYGPTIVEKIA